MAVNVYQRDPDEYQMDYPNPVGFLYVFRVEVIWPDTNLWPIREWLLDRFGKEGPHWQYHYDSVWFSDVNHAMEFKLRWL